MPDKLETKKVLIVDDNSETIGNLSAALREKGFEVLTVTTPPEGGQNYSRAVAEAGMAMMRFAKENKASLDLVLVDYLAGNWRPLYEFARKAGIPVAVMTVNEQILDHAEANLVRAINVDNFPEVQVTEILSILARSRGVKKK